VNESGSVDPFVRYLEAKKSIDDRSLNDRVWRALATELARFAPARGLDALELGCGIGTMLERALERGLFGGVSRVEYTLVDASAELLAAGRQRLPGWSSRLGLTLEMARDHDRLQLADGLLQAHWVAADAFDLAAEPARAGAYDLLLAHAFLDLVDARHALQAFLPLLRRGGAFYFSLVFDGITHFEPGLEPELDSLIERLYHETMDRRLVDGRPSGHSRTGRRLLTLLPEAGGQILEAGGSDWVVIPRGGGYLPEESALLDHLLTTIQQALADHPQLDRRDLERWVERRRAQLARGELSYLAHQLDLFGRYMPNE